MSRDDTGRWAVRFIQLQRYESRKEKGRRNGGVQSAARWVCELIDISAMMVTSFQQSRDEDRIRSSKGFKNVKHPRSQAQPDSPEMTE